MEFGSDNTHGVAPEILAAIARANHGPAPSYGADALTAAVEKRFCEIFERQVAVFLVATGGAANGLALSALAPPYGMILCHQESHIEMDECGGPEFFTGGAKLLPLPGFAAKLDVATVETALAGFPERPPHGAPPSVLSLTQASECGAVYTAGEMAALCASAHARGLSVHVDGARFANAVASLGCAPADITWKAGVDALSFGATKNGCLAAEAVVFFDPETAGDFIFRRKRSGQLLSKHRYLSAQFEAYLDNGLWLRMAAHANRMAARLSAGLAAIDGVRIWYPTEANEVFVEFPDGVAEALHAAGAHFYPWLTPGDPSGGRMHRLVASFATAEEEVDRFLALAREEVEGCRL